MLTLSLSPAQFATLSISSMLALSYAVIHQGDMDQLADLVALMGRARAFTTQDRDHVDALHAELRQLLQRVRQGGPWAVKLPR
jgi:hypothetical protein